MLEGNENEETTSVPIRLIRLKEVMHRVGLGRSTIYRWMNEGKFPKPHQIGTYNVRWLESDIDDWIVKKTAFQIKS